jgi:hypothetical protein
MSALTSPKLNSQQLWIAATLAVESMVRVSQAANLLKARIVANTIQGKDRTHQRKIAQVLVSALGEVISQHVRGSRRVVDDGQRSGVQRLPCARPDAETSLVNE